MKKAISITLKIFGVLVILFIILSIYRAPSVLNKQKQLEEVTRINQIKLDDATIAGTNIPPAPNEVENNSTVAGVDVNNNLIRDDIELYIIETHKDNREYRLAALQYAQALQAEMFAHSWLTYSAVDTVISKSENCIFQIPVISTSTSRYELGQIRGKRFDDITDEIVRLTYNTEMRKTQHTKYQRLVEETPVWMPIELDKDCPLNI